MLRSFAYAAATGAAEVGGLGVNPTVETRSARWERDARTAFLEGYGAAHDQPLITLFEMEKVFYELAYELNNRLGWTWIPLRGIAKLF
jgi:maltose alpha-D-glucosyltransferase/alpha-amylase